jgi:hypothetical protein
LTNLNSLQGTIDSEFRDILQRKKEGKKVSFSVTSLYEKIEPLLLNDSTIFEAYLAIERNINSKVAKTVFSQVFRFSFLSQVVMNKGGAANYTAHWRTPFLQADPRYAECEDCFQMFKEVFSSFNQELEDINNCNNFKNSIKCKYSCIDYKTKVLEGKIHHPGNIYWMWDNFPSRVVKLKLFLIEKATNSETASFFKRVYSKIETKTYLTDRGQTGGHQTNRERRWEVHPQSVHFALYRDCLEIEYTLVKQILELYNFPVETIKKLEGNGVILEGEVIPNSRRCPITMDKLFFDEFRDELANPVHGKARFQVGHIHPLKANTLDASLGHTAQNICWITAEGNEIQKNRSVEDTQALIMRISKNYQEAGIFEDYEKDEDDAEVS